MRTPNSTPTPLRWVGLSVAAVLAVVLLTWGVVALHHGSGSQAPAASGPASAMQIRGVDLIIAPDAPSYAQTKVTCGPADPCTDDDLLHASHLVLLDAAGVKYRLGPVVVSGENVASARAAQLTGTQRWLVNFQLTPAGAQRLAEVTQRLAEVLPPRQIATVVDGQVVEASTVEGPVSGGAGQIRTLTEAQARSLVSQLSSPQGPAPS